MLLPTEEKKVKDEATTSILVMSGKELLNEVKKEPEKQFTIVRKLRVILTALLWKIYLRKFRSC
jgi:hypothetical protein